MRDVWDFISRFSNWLMGKYGHRDSARGDHKVIYVHEVVQALTSGIPVFGEPIAREYNGHMLIGEAVNRAIELFCQETGACNVEVEAAVPVAPNVELVGHIDLVDVNWRWAAEVKTTGELSLSKLPYKTHVIQASIYKQLLEHMIGKPIRFYLLYFIKGGEKWRIYPVTNGVGWDRVVEAARAIARVRGWLP